MRLLAVLLLMTFTVSSYAAQKCNQAQTNQASDYCGKTSRTLSSCTNNGNGTFLVGCKDAAGIISNSTLKDLISPLKQTK
jgi:hypothetical protein